MTLPIRLRIAIASTIATVLLLGAAGLIFLTTLRDGLQDTPDKSLQVSVSELQTQLNTDGSLASPGGKLTLVGTGYAQVFAADGSLRESSEPELSKPLLTAAQVKAIGSKGRSFNISARQVGAEGHSQDVRVLAVQHGTAGVVVAAALNGDVVDDAVDRAGKQLLVVGALVLIVAAIGSYLLARTALKPVDQMRAQAAELEARDAGGGLTVPKANDEIGRLASTLNDLLARLHDAVERERAFVADAGHELRTPLTVLRGELELARRPGRSREELVETVVVASEETERLIRLADDLLGLAREETGTAMHRSSFDLMQVLEDAVARVRSVASENDVRIAVEGSSPLLVSADRDRIRQAVDNVLVNALRFAPRGTVISISVSSDDGQTTIRILDEGPGFSVELLPFVFERFRRGDQARTRAVVADVAVGETTVGAGLGLAIVRSVLRSHGGEAIAMNRPDRRGACVILQWPAPSTTERTGTAPGPNTPAR
jgi:two-component system OmpR family sensor kinase